VWSNVCAKKLFFLSHRTVQKNNKIKTWSTVQSASISWWCYVQTITKCVLYMLLVWQNNGCVGGLLDCAQTPSVFSALCINHSWPLLARRSAQPNLSIFSSKWFKPPRKFSHTVYSCSSQSTFIECLSSTENSIVFIIINNNNPMSQIITSSQSKNGSGVVVKFNNWVGSCQHNSCARNVKIKITIQKLWRENDWPLFCGHGV